MELLKWQKLTNAETLSPCFCNDYHNRIYIDVIHVHELIHIYIIPCNVVYSTHVYNTYIIIHFHDNGCCLLIYKVCSSVTNTTSHFGRTKDHVIFCRTIDRNRALIYIIAILLRNERKKIERSVIISFFLSN